MKRKITSLGYLGACCACMREGTCGVQLTTEPMGGIVVLCEACARGIAAWANSMMKARRSSPMKSDDRRTK